MYIKILISIRTVHYQVYMYQRKYHKKNNNNSKNIIIIYSSRCVYYHHMMYRSHVTCRYCSSQWYIFVYLTLLYTCMTQHTCCKYSNQVLNFFFEFCQSRALFLQMPLTDMVWIITGSDMSHDNV